MSDDPEIQEKIDALVRRFSTPRPERRGHAVHRGTVKVQGPSQLADLDGSRRMGPQVRMSQGQSKAPKRRFNPGDRFQHDGSEWELVYMYRLRSSPNIWHHLIEERRSDRTDSLLGVWMDVLGAGETTERVVFTPFAHQTEADKYFGDIPRKGDSLIRTTQQLLGMKKVAREGG